MKKISQFLLFIASVMILIVLYGLFSFNPHPNSKKSDKEYAESENYKIDYNLSELDTVEPR